MIVFGRGHRGAAQRRLHHLVIEGVVNGGTIPSKSMREAVVYLTGLDQREIYGASYRVKERITWADLHTRTDHIIKKEIDVVRNQLIRNRIELYTGHARFINEHAVLVVDPTSSEHTVISGDYIIIATGTTPARPSGVQFDDERVIDSDGILNLTKIPSSMVVVGAGVIGIEYASIFAALGTKVTVVDKRDTMLGFCDDEIVEALQLHLRDQSVTFRFDEEVTTVDIHQQGAVTKLASGKLIPADTVMYSAGRQGCTDRLGLENTRLQADNRGLISGRRQLPHQCRAHLCSRRRPVAQSQRIRQRGVEIFDTDHALFDEVLRFARRPRWLTWLRAATRPCS